MPEDHRAQHDLLGQFVGFRLHHQHGSLGSRDDEVKRRGFELDGGFQPAP